MVNKINKDILIAGDGIVANLLINLLGKNNFNTYQVSKKSKKSYNPLRSWFLYRNRRGIDQDP